MADPAALGSAPAVGWRLSPSVHGVAIGADLVLLDVEADAYFCLVDAAAAVKVTPEGTVDVADDDARETLLAAGLITAGPAERPARPSGLARRDLFLDIATPTTAERQVWPRLLRASLSARLHLQGRSFAQLLAWAGERAPDDTRRWSPPSPSLAAEAARFSRARVWAPFDGACLARSYMALRYLRLCGQDAAWVIGVRTWPFSAHCWLQSGDVVLDDSAERVLPYHPILVV